MMLWVLFTLMAGFYPNALAARRSYIAATLEHNRLLSIDDPPDMVIDENLISYKKAAVIAASKGADIMVFPETGLYHPGNRTMLKAYLEYIPDPKQIRTNPCEEQELYSDRPILRRLSCMAKNYSLVIVANMGDIQNCSGDPDCPEDGVYHYNTNVVFDKTGTLLMKYYKEHLFFEYGMDVPKHPQDPIFETEFGTFATFICFDILYKRMSEVAEWPQVDGIMFSAMWSDANPQYTSVPLWQGFGIGHNIPIVVSNIQIPGYTALGSGIFYGRYGSLAYTYNPDGISKVVVAEIPVSGPPDLSRTSVTGYDTGHPPWVFDTDGRNVSTTCSMAILGYPNDTDEYRCFDETTSNYTLVKLTSPSGYVEACNNGMCCSLNYSADSMREDFYLGVYNGTFNSSNRYFWCEESCFIARCDELEGRPCATFPRRAWTYFYHIDIKANFSTEYVYPSVVGSSVRLLPVTLWDYDMEKKSAFESSIHFESKSGRNIINAGFKGRCYDRDPPYRR